VLAMVKYVRMSARRSVMLVTWRSDPHPKGHRGRLRRCP
jgi:hypothetical protein